MFLVITGIGTTSGIMKSAILVAKYLSNNHRKITIMLEILNIGYAPPLYIIKYV